MMIRLGAALLLVSCAAETALAQPMANTVPISAPPAAAPAATPAAKLRIPEGTEMLIRFEDPLSSGKNSEGDQFSVRLEDDVTLPDGTVLHRGYRGRGEVTQAKKKGFMGQAGEMNVRINYIKVGDTKVKLRANKGGEGQGAMGTTIALTVLFGPLGLLKHGHDVEIKPGQTLTAYVDEDASVDLPLAAAPTGS